MKCPDCGVETQYFSEGETMVGYSSPRGHDHDDNCRKRYYQCANGHDWVESIRRTCPRPGCDWRGKAHCDRCGGAKVDAWTDPERTDWSSP